MMLAKGANIFSKVMAVIVGIAFIIGGLVFFAKYDPSAYDVKASGTIVDIEEHYELIGGDNELVSKAYIDYSADGTEYKHIEFPEYNSKMKIGDKVEFYYMSSDPTRIAGLDKDNARYFGLVFAAAGAVILAVMAVRTLRGKRF